MSSLNENNKEYSKINLENKLKDIGFTNVEIKEVISVIEKAEATISLELKELNSKNNSSEDLKIAFYKIKSIHNKMNEDIKEKIEEIKERKRV